MNEELTKNLFINLTDPVVFQSFGGEEYWEKVDVPAGQVILDEGEGTEDFYYIFSGLASVDKKMAGGGLQRHLANMEQGDFFGEGALLSDKERAATVTASSDCVLLKLSEAKFKRLVQDDPDAAVALLLGIVKVLNARLQVTTEQLAELGD